MLEYLLNASGDSYEVLGETDRLLSRVEIPDTYNGLPVTISSAMFGSEFPNLKEIVFGKNIQKTNYASFECPTLERIYFNGPTSSVSGPLNDCTSLSDIYYCGTENDWNSISFNAFDADSLAILEKINVHFGSFAKKGYLTLSGDRLLPITDWECINSKPFYYEKKYDDLQVDTILPSNATNKINGQISDGSAAVCSYVRAATLPEDPLDFMKNIICVRQIINDSQLTDFYPDSFEIVENENAVSLHVLEHEEYINFVIAIKNPCEIWGIQFEKSGIYFGECVIMESMNTFIKKIFFKENIKKLDEKFLPECFDDLKNEVKLLKELFDNHVASSEVSE